MTAGEGEGERKGPQFLILGDIEYLHIDDHFIIINKPSGLLSVPGRGADKADCAISRIQARFQDALTVHRLDMETSGLMVFARGALAQSAISRAFEQRNTQKTYIAVVAGLMAKDSGTIDAPLIADWPNRPKQIIDHSIGKPSLTHYHVLARYEDTQQTRVELTPITGRSHQLRVHLQSIGHPILGDSLYASPEGFKAARRLLLHASALSLPHPVTGELATFSSAAPF